MKVMEEVELLTTLHVSRYTSLRLVEFEEDTLLY